MIATREILLIGAVCCALLPAALPAQDRLVISEFLASNSATILDDFGESSDYIEICNGTANSINLENYYLTDSLSRKTQWQFPATNLDSGAYLVVWASGHDRRTPGEPLHTNFKLDAQGEALALIQPDQVTVVHEYEFSQQLIDRTLGLQPEVVDSTAVLTQGAIARYLVPADDALGKRWTAPEFDDGIWAAGSSGFGFDLGSGSPFAPWISTDVGQLLIAASPQRSGMYLRIPFVVSSGESAANLMFQARYDDGFVAYLNGTEVARRGIGARSVTGYGTTATLSRGNDVAVLPEDLTSLAFVRAVRAGTNLLAIHVFNRAAADVDFLIVPEVFARRLRYATNAVRYFAAPSPGFANSAGYLNVSAGLDFSVKSRTFLEAFELVISPNRPAPGAELRYTVDGSVPATNSTLYTGPLQMTSSMQIRARLFEPGFLPGPVRTEAYARLSPEMAGVSSDLPLILVHSFGVGTFTEALSKACLLFVHEPRRGRASFTNVSDMVIRAGLKLRGSSSVGNPKYNWAVDCWDEADRDLDLPLLGLPAGAEWVFHAPYMTDTALINNPLASAMSHAAGRYAPHVRSVELYLNQRPSGQSQATIALTNYFGVYNILQRIGIDPNRVNIDKLTDQDTEPPEVTGGYLLNIDRNIDGPLGFTAGGQIINYGQPNHSEMMSPARDAQRNYLNDYLNNFAAVLNSDQWTNPVTGYAPFVDTGSWIDFHLINIIAINGEVPGNSTFFYKPRNGPIAFGPVWDFDKAFAWSGSVDTAPQAWDPGRGAFGNTWWGRLFQDPKFWQSYIDRFQELDAGPYGIPGIWALIDRLNAEVTESAVRDMVRWKQPKRGGSQESDIGYFKSYIARRIRFMETNFLARPDILERSGQVRSGAAVSLSGPAGATILYTLDGTDPRAPHGGVAANAVAYTGPILIAAETRLVARSRDDNHRNLTGSGNPPLSSPWSGPVKARYTMNAPPRPGDLLVSELNYHPSPPTREELSARGSLRAGDFEFIEILNVSNQALDLIGCRFTRGVSFDFSSSNWHTLAPGARLLLAKDPAALTIRYRALANIAGAYSGSLDNAGQTLRLEDPSGVILFEFAYDSGWYPSSDGFGFTLVRRPLATLGSERLAWGLSSAPLGAPGIEDSEPGSNDSVVVSEILANAEPPLTDAIELQNLSAVPADISGWFLTDDPGQPRKFRVPGNSVIAPGSFWVVTSAAFAAPAQGTNAFKFSSQGDQVWLFAADQAGSLRGYAHGFAFGASDSNTSLGRLVTSAGEEQFVAQEKLTLGAANAGPKAGPVVLREIFYHPSDVFENGAFWDNDEDEYIVMQNLMNSPVPLADMVRGQPWRLRGTVEFEFPQAFVLGPQHSAILVSFDPSQQPERLLAWRQRWGIDAVVPILGPFRGKMDNSKGELRLEKPGSSDGSSDDVPYVVVDRVAYRDSVPWPAAADAGGASLHRSDPALFGNDPAHWTAALPSPNQTPPQGGPPSVLAAPASQTVVGGGRVVLTVGVVPNSYYSLHWRHNGATLPTATNAQLVLDPVDLSDAGVYSVVLVNASGSLETEPARLTVLRPATIVRHPNNQALRPGANALFAVAAAGRGLLSYQWLFDGSPIPGATAASYLLAGVKLADSGAYRVQVTDSVGPVVSDPGVLSVLVRPSFELQPQSLVALVGDSVELRVEVEGLKPFTYRWRKGTVAIANATNATLRLGNLQPNDAGSYSVIVTNLASGVAGTNSQAATLVVMNDADHDGIGDEWETQFGYSNNLATDASIDEDGDYQTTRQEFVAGTDPHDPLDYLHLGAIRLTDRGAELAFTAQANRGYTLQYRDSLGQGPWRTLRHINGRAVPSQEAVLDATLRGGIRFYRLVTPQQF